MMTDRLQLYIAFNSSEPVFIRLQKSTICWIDMLLVVRDGSFWDLFPIRFIHIYWWWRMLIYTSTRFILCLCQKPPNFYSKPTKVTCSLALLIVKIFIMTLGVFAPLARRFHVGGSAHSHHMGSKTMPESKASNLAIGVTSPLTLWKFHLITEGRSPHNPQAIGPIS